MTIPNIQVRRATRQALKVKIGIEGPAGAGKTEGALALATGISNGGRILVADSENESASYYADRYSFDTTGIDSQTTTRQIVEIIHFAVANKYDVLCVDSLSRIWQNVRDAKDAYELANPLANKWATWGLPQFGGGWEKMMKAILDAPIHIVATMRSKMAHEQIEENGKKKVVKLGLQAQVRDGAEYEFGLVFSVNMNHFAEATKDRTHLFETGELVDLTEAKLHKRLIGWMNSETPASHEEIAKLVELAQRDGVPDVTRKAIEDVVSTGIPSANKVLKYTAKIEEHLASIAQSAQSADADDVLRLPTAKAEVPTDTPAQAETRAKMGRKQKNAQEAEDAEQHARLIANS